MVNAESILRNGIAGNNFKFLEVEKPGSQPKLRGTISALKINNISAQVIDLQIELSCCSEQCLGQNEWVAPDREITSLELKFHENKFNFLGLQAAPILIISDEDGNEYLIFKPDDSYVNGQPGFRN